MPEVIGLLTADSDEDREHVNGVVADLVREGFVVPADTPAYEQLIDQLLPQRVPTSATVDQARRNALARQQLIEETGALTAEQVHTAAGLRGSNPRATASRWASEDRIFGVGWHGRTLYPAFQFDNGRPRHVIAQVLAELPPQLTGWPLALWWATPADALDGQRPLDRLDNDVALIAAAKTETANWRFAAGDPA
jgi:hypothetical protein